MAPDPVLSGLLARRAELYGEAVTIRSRLQQLDVDLVHLDAVIRQFDPDYNPASVRPKRPTSGDVARRGERSRLLLDVLREAGKALGTAEVMRRMMLRLGQDGHDRKAAREFTKRVEAALSRQEKAGALRSVREIGRAVTWEVAGQFA